MCLMHIMITIYVPKFSDYFVTGIGTSNYCVRGHLGSTYYLMGLTAINKLFNVPNNICFANYNL